MFCWATIHFKQIMKISFLTLNVVRGFDVLHFETKSPGLKELQVQIINDS